MIKRIKVVFTKDIYLPRFGFVEGEQWEVRVDKLSKSGFQCGGGFIYNDDFEVVGNVS